MPNDRNVRYDNNTTAAWVIGIIAVLVILVAAYFLFFRNQGSTPGVPNTGTTQTGSQSGQTGNSSGNSTNQPTQSAQPSPPPSSAQPTQTPAQPASGSGSSGNSSGATQPATTPTPKKAVVSISMANMAYVPANVTVEKGATVTWTNNDSVAHTVTSDTQSFSSATLQPGEHYSHTFNTVGTFAYHCSIHPNMRGTITVAQ